MKLLHKIRFDGLIRFIIFLLIIPIAGVLIPFIILVVPFILISLWILDLRKRYKTRIFLKENEGKIFFCVTNGNRQRCFVQNHRNTIEENARIVICEGYANFPNHELIQFIDTSVGFPQVAKIEQGKVRSVSFKKEYKNLRFKRYRTSSFVEILTQEFQKINSIQKVNFLS